MNTETQETTVRQSIVVDAPIERAFQIFVEEFDRIKPREHNLLSVDIAETVFEPRAGGHIYDRGIDGSVCRWSRVLEYEPPNRLLFSWDITPTWQIEANPDLTSEVEVRFHADTPGQTRVELKHRHLDRHNHGWESVRDGVGGDGGWPLYLNRYRDAIG